MTKRKKLLLSSTLLLLLLTFGGYSVVKDPFNPISESSEKIADNYIDNTIDLPLVNSFELPFDPSKLRGFNLQSRILVGDWVAGDADDWAFNFMKEEGFNFARIPMEVQELYTDDNYTQWNNAALLEIDRIIALGQKYQVHILLDLHTLPGIRPSELPISDSNFTSEERLAIWKDIFQVLSSRYKGIPNTDLSYNLINEPYQLDNLEYMSSINQVLDVIRRVDQTKVIFIDPNHWSGQPLSDLTTLEDPYLIASPHFYQPFLVTHYKAEWVAGADTFPVPEYPSVDFNGFIYGNAHPELQKPLKIKGSFDKGTILTIRIDDISDFVDLTIDTDKESLFHDTFQTNDDTSIWKVVNYNEEWQIYQNKYDQDITMVLTEDANKINVQLVSGDWLTISSITIDTSRWQHPFQVIARSNEWGQSTDIIAINDIGFLDFENSSRIINKDYLFENYFKEWVDFYQKTGIPVVACEFGVYHMTNHQITLRVLEDNLSLFKENNMGYALWNLTGAFGIFDSGRKDVTYEDYEGHLLDRTMLDLLKEY